MNVFEQEVIVYDSSRYQEVSRIGTLVSVQAALLGGNNICHRGRLLIEERAVLRGDLARIALGDSVVIEREAVLCPGQSPDSVGFEPLAIGDYTSVERGACVSAASVGAFCRVGRNAVLGRGCIVQDCADIAPDAVLAPGTVVPAQTRVAGSPAVPVAALPFCWRDVRRAEINRLFASFRRR